MVHHADFAGSFWKEGDGKKPEEPILSFLRLNNLKVS